MKTNQEIQAEAQQLMVLGRQFQNEQGNSNLIVATQRTLVNLPVDPVTSGRERHIVAALAGGALVFRLMERDTDLPGTEYDGDGGTLLATSPSPYDVLSMGYELAEEERLAVLLEPYAERSEDRADAADDETVAEVEAIMDTKLLPPTDRLRTKAEIVEFLEGRLEPSVLITHAVERQGAREGHREHLAERHEYKLTIGEP